jgi:hypothetical protein
MDYLPTFERAQRPEWLQLGFWILMRVSFADSCIKRNVHLKGRISGLPQTRGRVGGNRNPSALASRLVRWKVTLITVKKLSDAPVTVAVIGCAKVMVIGYLLLSNFRPQFDDFSFQVN